MVAQTPPMGWNSWDCYGASVTEDIVRKNADFMAKNLKKHGWQYVVVDIQWYEPTANCHEYHNFTELQMDEYSRLIPAANRFPSSAGGKGFAPLAEYVHSLGLKFGIHIMRGIPRQAVHRNTALKGTDKTARQIAAQSSTCRWNTDMYGVDCSKDGAQAYYDSIFELYADWGVDFVKVDDICNHHPEDEIEMINAAIGNSGREMVLSLSPGPAILEKAEHLKQYANMWRITDDFWDKWELLYDMFSRAEKWCTHSGAGHWPDADMLPIGPILQDYDKNNHTKFTEDEQITMLSLWCIMRSPLIIGGEMTGFDDFTMSLIDNDGMIEMLNKTHSAHQLFRIAKDTDGVHSEKIAWTTTHCDGKSFYLALFNAGDKNDAISAKLPVDGEFEVTNVWSGKREDNTNGDVTAVVPSHGASVFKLTRV